MLDLYRDRKSSKGSGPVTLKYVTYKNSYCSNVQIQIFAKTDEAAYFFVYFGNLHKGVAQIKSGGLNTFCFHGSEVLYYCYE